MRRVLHLLTKAPDAMATEVLGAQQASEECQVEVVDLRQPDPDYEELVRKIFAADSVETW